MSDQVIVAAITAGYVVTNALVGLVGLKIRKDLAKQGVPEAPVTTSTLVEGMAIQVNQLAQQAGTPPSALATAYEQVISDLEQHLRNGESETP